MLTAEVRLTHAPVTVPEKVLTQGETERYWGRDRAGLVMCEAGKATVIQYYDMLAKQFAGANLRK